MSKTKHSAAFTAVELLAATALAAVLMAAVMGVIASLGPMRQAITDRGERTLWKEDLIRLLRHDLAEARRITAPNGVLVVEGWRRLDPRTLSGSHLPTRVRYRLVRSEDEAGVGLLVREQTDLLDLTNRPTRAMLVCVGVEDFKVELLAELENESSRSDSSPPEAPPAPAPPPEGEDEKTLRPRRVRVRIDFDAATGASSLVHTFVLGGENS